jgi:hypothetical protein
MRSAAPRTNRRRHPAAIRRALQPADQGRAGRGDPRRLARSERRTRDHMRLREGLAGAPGIIPLQSCAHACSGRTGKICEAVCRTCFRKPLTGRDDSADAPACRGGLKEMIPSPPPTSPPRHRKAGKKSRHTTATAKLGGATWRHHRSHSTRNATTMPALPKLV